MRETFMYKGPDKAIRCPNDDQLAASGGTWEATTCLAILEGWPPELTGHSLSPTPHSDQIVQPKLQQGRHRAAPKHKTPNNLEACIPHQASSLSSSTFTTDHISILCLSRTAYALLSTTHRYARIFNRNHVKLRDQQRLKLLHAAQCSPKRLHGARLWIPDHISTVSRRPHT